MDTLIVFAASYDSLGAAEADFTAVHDLYVESGLIDTYDAAVEEVAASTARLLAALEVRPGGAKAAVSG